LLTRLNLREPGTRPPPAEPPPPPARPEEGGEDTHPSKAYAGLWSRRDRAPKVEFRRLPAHCRGEDAAEGESLDYAWLARVRWFPGRPDGQRIVLPFTDLGFVVTIRGRHLFDLKEKLRAHLVTWVQEQGDDPLWLKSLPEDLPVVYEIRFEESGGPAG
jgi:hypothetical protein